MTVLIQCDMQVIFLIRPQHGGHQEDITVFPDVFHGIGRYYFF